MKVNIHLEVPFLVNFHNLILGGQNCWKFILFMTIVLSVKINALGIEAPHTSGNTVRVEIWNDLENVVLKKHLSLHIIEVREFV